MTHKVALAGLAVGLAAALVGPSAIAQHAAPHAAFSARPESSTVTVREQSPLQHKVSATFRGTRLGEAVDEIVRQAQLDLSYQNHMLDGAKLVTATFTNVSAEAALMALLTPNGLRVDQTSTGHYVIVKGAARATQDVGVISGHVTEAGTGKAIENAQVTVVGTSIKTVTDDKGAYTLRGVTAGAVTVTVRALGFQSRKSTATVTANATVTVNFSLTRQATVLADVVSTATGDQRRLEVPNAVARLNVDSLVATTPVRSITDLLATRIPGVEVTRSSGDVGAVARIRIRGISSAVGDNDPVVIIDGIRMTADGSTQNIRNLASGVAGSTSSSRLDDIDPQTVESIEVLRGPSASALYGSDAANGVIVIKTKHGQPGTTRWMLNVTHDWTSVPTNYPPVYMGYGHTASSSAVISPCTLQLSVAGFCILDSVSTFNPLNDKFTTNLGTGSNTQYSMGLSGGSQQVQYNITGSYHDAVDPERMSNADQYRLNKLGVSVPSTLKIPRGLQQGSIMSNLAIQPYQSLNLSATINADHQDNSANQGLVGSATGIASDTVNYTPMSYDAQIGGNKITRGLISLGGDWRPTDWMTATGTIGADHLNESDNGASFNYNCTLADGCVIAPNLSFVSTNNITRDNYTADGGVTLSKHLSETWISRTSVRGQYHRENLSALQTTAADFAVGSTNPSTAQRALITPSRGADATAGWYAEENLAYHERLFLSAALRQDAGSAFGDNVQAPVYPKLGVSWVVSEEPFFSVPGVSQLRLRLAYGHSGVQPPSTAAPPTYINDGTTTAVINGSVVNAIRYGSVGNSLLEPERDIETEGGFDADLFNSRVTVEFSAYNKASHGALIDRTLAPSVPVITGTQMQNLGKVVNRGFEVSVTGRLIDRGAFSWVATVSGSMNRNKVLSLGPATPFGDSANRIIPGYPLDSRWVHPILGFKDVNGDGVLESTEMILGDTLIYIGTTQPRYTMAYSTTVTLPSGISIDANLGYESGFTQIQSTYDGRGLYDPTASLAEQAYAYTTQGLWGAWQTVSVLRLNSVSLNYTLPVRFARSFRANSAVISFSGTNLGMWTKYRGADPSINSTPVGDQLTDNGTTLPLTRNWSMGLRLGF